MNGRANYSHFPGCEWITARAKNYYSQFGEDGMIDAIFETIGFANRWCFECGAADGIMFSNTRRLIERGWAALLVEQDEDSYKRLLTTATPKVTAVHGSLEVHGENSLDAILKKYNAPKQPDLLCIDIDGQDFHVWNSLMDYWPRVVIIEHAAPGTCDEKFIPLLGGPGIASAWAMRAMAASRGYMTACETFTNSICVRIDLATPLIRDAAKNIAKAFAQ